jgi:SAM-dependent methyltransferase
MTDREAAACWESNAQSWTDLARQGYDAYRDLISSPAFFEMLPPVDGMRALDVGSGEGANTRALARRGARVCAIDISPTFVRHASSFPDSPPIDYAIACGQRLPFAAASFDFATAFMSLMDVPRPRDAMLEIARVLKPGGFFQFSITHPCFMTPHRRKVRNSEGREFAVELGGYFDTGGRTDEWLFSAAPPEVQARHRPFRIPVLHLTLSDWLNWIAETGFHLEQTMEPRATPEFAERHPQVADTRIHAYFLLLRCRKAAVINPSSG